MITTEWLESVGCKINGYWAYDVRGVCVAQKSFDKDSMWTRWKNYRGEIPRATFRVKAISEGKQ
jgi:hypothetical protein